MIPPILSPPFQKNYPKKQKKGFLPILWMTHTNILTKCFYEIKLFMHNSQVPLLVMMSKDFESSLMKKIPSWKLFLALQTIIFLKGYDAFETHIGVPKYLKMVLLPFRWFAFV